MIRFICSRRDFEAGLKAVMDFEIEYVGKKEGILTIDVKQLDQLDLFCMQVAQDQGISLTCLTCFDQNELTTQLLKLAHQMMPNKVHRQSTILLAAISRKDQEILSLMNNWLNRLNPNHLEFSRAYIANEGSSQKTAQYLYVHRNTVNNRLQQFQDITGMDLRDWDNLVSLKIMLDYQQY